MEEGHAANPGPEAISTMRFLITAQRCTNNAMQVQLAVELEGLSNMRTNRICQINALAHGPFNVEDCEQMEIFSGDLTRIDKRMEEVRRQIQELGVHFTARLKNALMCHVLRSPLVEVNDVQTSRAARWMFDHCGWQGVVCYDITLPENVIIAIFGVLGPVPRRAYTPLLGAPLAFHPVEIPQNEN